MSSWLLVILASLAFQCASGIFFGRGSNFYMFYLRRHGDEDCDFAGRSSIAVDSPLKLTTAKPPEKSSKNLRICEKPLVPSGNLVRDRRGMKFWYLRLKITKLTRGQKLQIVNVDFEGINAMVIESDQRIDLNSTSHRYPLILDMKYRYVKFYWVSPPHIKNVVDISVSRYALYNKTVNTTMRRLLCQRYGYRWCENEITKPGVCVSPGSCNIQKDCFQDFTISSSECASTGHNNTSIYSINSSWASRNLPWIAFAALPVILIFALVKICSQKRDLDIDDDYEFKISYSDHEQQDREAIEPSLRRLSNAGSEADRKTNRSSRSSHKTDSYYSYPAFPDGPDTECLTKAIDKETGEVQVSPTRYQSNQTLLTDSSSSDSDDDVPPPPPPRLSQTTGCRLANQRSPRKSLQPAVLDAVHEEEEASQPVTRSTSDEEEEEDFVNINYLRQLPLLATASQANPLALCNGKLTSPTAVKSPVVPETPEEYTDCNSETAPRDSYTKLLTQPSPDTMEELMKTPQAACSSPQDGVVYAQLVLPPPSRKQAKTVSFGKSQRAPAPPTNPEALEMRDVKAASRAPPQGPGKKTGDYDKHYIVV